VATSFRHSFPPREEDDVNAARRHLARELLTDARGRAGHERPGTVPVLVDLLHTTTFWTEQYNQTLAFSGPSSPVAESSTSCKAGAHRGCERLTVRRSSLGWLGRPGSTEGRRPGRGKAESWAGQSVLFSGAQLGARLFLQPGWAHELPAYRPEAA
jgi:hypothetical protein